MKEYNYSKGKNGEDVAKKFLIGKGYEFIDANHENPRGEIDLIMAKNQTLVFVEVKLKTGDRYGRPEEMINRWKINRLIRAGEVFLVLNPEINQKYKRYQLDAVCIVCDTTMKVTEIKHYENISL